MIYEITPMPKPRMTQRDKWKKRDVVLRYLAFKDTVKREGVMIPVCGAHVTFQMPMPKSWSKKKRRQHIGLAHQQRPDFDNLIKGLLDAVYDDDSIVWDCRVTKVWGEEGRIIINF